MASPEQTAREVVSFRPHLLVHTDTDGVDAEALVGVPFWVEVRYSNDMDARISADGEVSEVADISMEDLLRAVDEAAVHLGSA